MPISKIKSSSITADAASTNLNIDAGTLFLDVANNNVGIGNTSPASYNGSSDNLVIGTSGSNGMTIVSGSTSSGYIMFADGTAGQQAYEGQITYDHTSNFMAFNTTAAERIRIDSSGNVGIGVNAPVNKLEVNGAIVAKGAAAGYSANMTIIDVASGNSNITAIGSNTSTVGTTVFQAFSSNASLGGERMRITAAGNVGIGTTNPQDMLDVSGSARIGEGQVSSNATVGTLGIYSGMTFNTGNAQLKFFGKSVDNTGLTYELGRISSGSLGSAYTIGGGLAFSTASNNGANVMTLSERMRITATGNVSIGTTNAFSRLSVQGTGSAIGLTTDAALRIVPSGTGSTDQIIFGYAESGSYANAAIGFTATDYNGYQKGHIFFANRNSTSNVIPTERMRITAPGELLLGQTSAALGAGISLQPNLATAAVGHSGSFATVWNIPNGTCGIFTANMGGNGQYGGARLFFVVYGAASGFANASIQEIGTVRGDQSGYNWSWNLASNGQFQMRNDTNTAAFVPIISMLTLG